MDCLVGAVFLSCLHITDARSLIQDLYCYQADVREAPYTF